MAPSITATCSMVIIYYPETQPHLCNCLLGIFTQKTLCGFLFNPSETKTIALPWKPFLMVEFGQGTSFHPFLPPPGKTVTVAIFISRRQTDKA